MGSGGGLRRTTYYAVAYGRKIGVTTSDAERLLWVSGFAHACHKKFNTRKEAEAYIVEFEEEAARLRELEPDCQPATKRAKTEREDSPPPPATQAPSGPTAAATVSTV
jgi:viroplasmin and RNaseH domain-containing protein